MTTILREGNIKTRYRIGKEQWRKNQKGEKYFKTKHDKKNPQEGQSKKPGQDKTKTNTPQEGQSKKPGQDKTTPQSGRQQNNKGQLDSCIKVAENNGKTTYECQICEVKIACKKNI